VAEPIDLIHRYDPDQPEHDPPANADAARRLLVTGNRRFARWIDSCADERPQVGKPPEFVIPCSAVELGLKPSKQTPFAFLLGCSDSRVPAETIFGSMRNHLFVVRMAGNVLSEDCMGSLDYAAHQLDTLRIGVVLGHSGCGAVAAAVDTYLDPWSYLGLTTSPALRSIVERLLVPVRKAAQALERVAGAGVERQAGYREALREAVEMINAMHSAYGMRQQLELAGKRSIVVHYGVFDLEYHRIRTAPPEHPGGTVVEVVLAEAPATLKEFEALSFRVARRAARRLTGPGK